MSGCSYPLGELMQKQAKLQVSGLVDTGQKETVVAFSASSATTPSPANRYVDLLFFVTTTTVYVYTSGNPFRHPNTIRAAASDGGIRICYRNVHEGQGSTTSGHWIPWLCVSTTIASSDQAVFFQDSCLVFCSIGSEELATRRKSYGLRHIEGRLSSYPVSASPLCLHTQQ